jgi:ABC-2 type transport system permease protein
MIDGFRSGFIGTSDAPILTGIIVITSLNVILWTVCYEMFRRGYKLKS